MIHTLTEGGQLSTHSLRMLKQVFKVSILIALSSWITLFACFMAQLPGILYQAAWYHAQAHLFKNLSIHQMEVNEELWKKLTRRSIRRGEKIATQQVLSKTQSHADNLETVAYHNMNRAGRMALVILGGVLLFFFIRGRYSSKKQHIAGHQISPAWKVALRLRLTFQASPIRISSLPLVKGTETRHILVTGGTGSGKTNCFHHLLPQIRSKGQRAIIIDTTGVFVDRYYRPDDLILNPFDSRGEAWHPWIECENNFDYEALAESLIPKSRSAEEEYWHHAARAVFSAIMLKLAYSKKISELNHWFLFERLDKLAAFAQGTKAAAHLDMNSDRLAGSIRSVASSFVSCLEFVSDTESPFSIRKWIQSTEERNWLFLSCKPSQRAALNPLLSCWFSIAMRSLFLLEPDLKRRLWFIIDELSSLHRLRDLETFLSESRKYGGCALLALQSLSQLDSIYGSDVTHTIIGNCSTKIVFAEQDPETATRISKAFGEREIKEYQKGLSYGANDIRDGVNLTLQTKQQPLISPTAIQFLEKNQAFVRLPGHFPVTKINLKIAKN